MPCFLTGILRLPAQRGQRVVLQSLKQVLKNSESCNVPLVAVYSSFVKLDVN